MRRPEKNEIKKNAFFIFIQIQTDFQALQGTERVFLTAIIYIVVNRV